MIPPAQLPSNEEIGVLRLIEVFVRKQHLLLVEFRANLGLNADRLSLRKYSPVSVNVLKYVWTTAVHGAGVSFTNSTTNEFIDVHVGLFDSDQAFDAWRLEAYAESIHSTIQDTGRALELLAAKGLIRRHSTLPKHYELLLSQKLSE